MKFYDRLYGLIDTHDSYDAILTSEPMRRLGRVSLSVVPSWLTSTSVCSSKFEHSVGVLYLAQMLTQSGVPDDMAVNLHLAALLHDVGTPPFSHGSELFLERLTGKDHEAFAENILYATELDELIKKVGGDTDRVAALIRGEEAEYGAFVAGEIDVDNLDNTIRFGSSMGLLHETLYDPVALAKGMYLDEGEVALKLVDLDPLNRWEQCRRLVYEYVNGVDNLKPAMMLNRAMALAYEHDELGLDYFMMKDDQAYEYLLNETNDLTQKVMRRLDEWNYFSLVFEHVSKEPSEKLKSASEDVTSWNIAADELAKLLAVPTEDVSVRIRKDKGSKQLTLPIYDLHGVRLEFESLYQPGWMVQVFVAKEHKLEKKIVGEYLNDKLDLKENES